MDWGAWWATVHGVAKSQTRLSDFTSLAGMLELLDQEFKIILITVLSNAQMDKLDNVQEQLSIIHR